MNKGSNHRRPLQHWKGGPPRLAWRVLGEFVVIVLAFLALIIVAESVCTALGCPVDPWALR